MKIPMNYHNNNDGLTAKSAQEKILMRDVNAAKKGDWNAKNHLAQTLMPLLTSIAQKRSSNTADINNYIEAGKKGLFDAVKKYKDGVTPGGFQVFALGFMEKEMDSAHKKKSGGFFSRLFGG